MAAETTAIPPFNPDDPAHHRAWESLCKLGRIEADRRASDPEKPGEPESEPSGSCSFHPGPHHNAQKRCIMADTTLGADSVSSNTAFDISRMAADLGQTFRSIRYLAAAADDAADDVRCHDETTRTALDRILVFAGLICEQTERGETDAEKIEIADCTERRETRETDTASHAKRAVEAGATDVAGWQLAKATWLAAVARLNAAAEEDHVVGDPPDEWKAAFQAECDAWKAVSLFPIFDVSALLDKIALLSHDAACEEGLSADLVEAIKADLQRIADASKLSPIP